MSVTAVTVVTGGYDDEKSLPAEVYGAIRGWKDRAKAEAQKKREALAERDELARQLQAKHREFAVLFVAVKCDRVSRRAQDEIRQLVKQRMRWSDAELAAWEQKKAEELATLDMP